MSVEHQGFEPRKMSQRKFLWLLISGIFVLLLIVAILTRVSGPNYSYNNFEGSNSSWMDNSNETIVDTSWIPTGYKSYDDTFAWRWGSNTETTCTYNSSYCWSIFIVTSEDCPGGVYGEISIFDSSDVQIDYTNDTTGAVYAGDTVKLTFDTFNEQSDSARISKLSCRSY